MPTNRFRSLPHPSYWLFQGLGWRLSDDSTQELIDNPLFELGWLVNAPGWQSPGLYREFIGLAPDSPDPAFPASVQYPGSTRSGIVTPWTLYPGVPNLSHYGRVFMRRPGGGLIQCTYPGGNSYTMVQTSTNYSASPDNKLWVALPLHWPDGTEVWSFTQGGDFGTDKTESPPGYPLFAYTESLLCYPLHVSERAGNWTPPCFWAVARCTAGFTPVMSTGSIADWQAGRAVTISDVSSFGYSVAVAVGDLTAFLGDACPVVML